MKRLLQGGSVNTRLEDKAQSVRNVINNPAEMSVYTPYENNNRNKTPTPPIAPAQTAQNPVIPPTSTTHLFSTKIRQLNNYPEWKTDEGINSVIYNLETGDIPPLQKKRFLEKYKNFFVQKIKGQKELFFGIKEKNNDNYNIILQVIRPQNKDKIMTDIYKDDTLGLGLGITQFYYQICRHYLNITRLNATEFLKKQGDYQIALIKNHKINNPITAKTSNERWGVDNVDMKRYKESVNNSSYIAFLTIVDYFSKKVWAVPNKDLEAKSNFEALMSICRKENTYPQIIQVDNGSAFYGDFKDLMNKHNEENPNNKIKIIYTTPHTPTANGLVERMNRELRKKIRAGFIRHDNLKWVNMLDTYTENINNQRSSNTKYTPNQIWTAGFNKTGQNEIPLEPITDETNLNDRRHHLKNQLIENSFKQYKNQQKDKEYEIGDEVRLKLSSLQTNASLYSKVRTRDKDKQDKKFNVINFSTTLFRIKNIYPSHIKTQQTLKELENHLSKQELFYRLQNKYSLEEQYEKDKWRTYKVQVQKKRLQDKDKEEPTYFIPKFYANDLINVPKDSTDITIEPSLKNVARLNTFDYTQEDAIVRENEKAGLKPLENRLRTRIKKEPVEIDPPTRITRSQTKPKAKPIEKPPVEVEPTTRMTRSQTKLLEKEQVGSGFYKRSPNRNYLPVSRFAGGGIMCYYK